MGGAGGDGTCHSTGCGEISELLGAYALGALGEDEAARVVAHLTRCAPCLSERDDLTVVVELLAKARPFFVPEPVSLTPFAAAKRDE